MRKQKEQRAEEKSLGTRYPLDVLADMQRLAKAHDRSFNGEVIWALRQYIAQQSEAQQKGGGKKEKRASTPQEDN